MMAARMPRVLMVTGAYWPELSGGGLQCRTLITAMGPRAAFEILTTCVDRRLPADDVVDGVPVHRVFVDVTSRASTLQAAVSMTQWLWRASSRFDIVHLHGFSRKSILVTLLARLLGMRVVITMHTAGQDDPEGVRRLGRVAYWAYRHADRVVAISHMMAEQYRAALPAERLRVVPNGLDTDRFRPGEREERDSLRRHIGAPAELPWILFVGFFSHDKRPQLLYEAWTRLREQHGVTSVLVCVGATESAYFEVDATLAASMRADARARGVEHLLRFTGEVRDVERYYRSADVFVMPSIREAFGMALIEAMATGLPAIATRIPGVTDDIVSDGRTGRLVAADDPAALASALRDTLTNPTASASMGEAARVAVMARYGLPILRDRWTAIYGELVQP